MLGLRGVLDSVKLAPDFISLLPENAIKEVKKSYRKRSTWVSLMGLSGNRSPHDLLK